MLSPNLKASEPGPFALEIEQLTSGAKHHFFGYIGQCQTIPWNASGRYILGMEIDRIDRMPEPEEAATVMLIDAHEGNRILRVEKTHAWNPQQGTMFYWNPPAPETQFLFNDREVETGAVFAVLHDIEANLRAISLLPSGGVVPRSRVSTRFALAALAPAGCGVGRPCRSAPFSARLA